MIPRLSLNQATTTQWTVPEAVAGCVSAGVSGIGLWRDPVAAHERFEQTLALCDRLGEGLYRPRIEQDLELISQSLG